MSTLMLLIKLQLIDIKQENENKYLEKIDHIQFQFTGRNFNYFKHMCKQWGEGGNAFQ